MDIILSNKFRTLSKYKGKSKFEFFKNIKINDILVITLKIESLSGGNNGLYSPTYIIYNMSESLNNNKSLYSKAVSHGDLIRYMNNIEIETI